MSNEKTHWKLLTNPDYIGAYWLPEGQDVTVTIDYVVREQITGSGGKKEECTVAHLRDAKPFILNATNSKSIAKLYGNFIEDWAGKPITLFASTTKMAGETVECLRIRPRVSAPKKEDITDTRLTAAIEKIKSGQYSAEKLRSNFQLTDAQEKELKRSIAEMVANAEPARGTDALP